MEKLLAALEEELNQTERQLDQEGPGGQTVAYRLPQKLEERQVLREAVSAGLKQLQQDGRSSYHPKEPEARRMKCAGRQPFAYNAQAVVDQSQSIVVATEVSREESDAGQLVGMVKQAQENTGARAVLSVADGGYGSGSQVALAAAEKLSVLVQPMDGGKQKDNGYSAHDFHYDESSASVSCPQKQQLDFRRQTLQKGQMVKQYRCHVKNCPAAALCKDKKGRRVIEIWPHTAAVQAMRQRLKQAQAQEQLSRRGRIIERHFGHLKQHDGFRRWTVRGLENVRTQWSLLNLTMNLRVLAKHWMSQKHKLN